MVISFFKFSHRGRSARRENSFISSLRAPRSLRDPYFNLSCPRFYLLLIPLLFIISCTTQKKKPEEKTILTLTDSLAMITPDTAANLNIPLDISPMDMSYYPVDYPKLKMAKTISTAPLARVIYSRPHLQGRILFQDLLKYGEPWRIGANESTELDLYHDATIQGKKIKEGRYVIYCIPQPDKWTIVLNANIDSWGLEPDSTKDIARFVIPVTHNTNQLEYLTIVFEKTRAGANLVMAWDDFEVRLPISF